MRKSLVSIAIVLVVIILLGALVFFHPGGKGNEAEPQKAETPVQPPVSEEERETPAREEPPMEQEEWIMEDTFDPDSRQEAGSEAQPTDPSAEGSAQESSSVTAFSGSSSGYSPPAQEAPGSDYTEPGTDPDEGEWDNNT